MMIMEESFASSMHAWIHYTIYEPKVILRVKGVVMIWHDVSENSHSYVHFANYLSQNGYVVVVSDLVGHGRSLIDFEQGYFGEGDVLEGIIEDMHKLQLMLFNRYRDTLYFSIGVGFGASLLKVFASRYGDYIQGMILLSEPKNFTFPLSITLRYKIVRRFKGPMHHSDRLLRKERRHLSNGIGRDPLAWMTHDEKEIRRFEVDTFSNFSYTLKGYKDLVDTNRQANQIDVLRTTPSYLPILLLSGDEDPITHKGKDTKEIYEMYKSLGITDLSMKIIKEGRHVLLKELNKEEVYKIIRNWLNDRAFI